MQTVNEWPALEYIESKRLNKQCLAIALGVSSSAVSDRLKRGGFYIIERPDGTIYSKTIKGDVK